MNLSTQQHYFLYNINLLWDTSLRQATFTGVTAENPEAVCVMQEGWAHQPHPFLQEKAELQFLILSFCKITKWLLAFNTLCSWFYHIQTLLYTTNEDSRPKFEQDHDCIKYDFPVSNGVGCGCLQCVALLLWNTSSSQSKHMWAGTSEVTAPLHFNIIIFPAVLLSSEHCCKCRTVVNGTVNMSPQSSHGFWMNAIQNQQHGRKEGGVMVATNTDLYLHPSI